MRIHFLLLVPALFAITINADAAAKPARPNIHFFGDHQWTHDLSAIRR